MKALFTLLTFFISSLVFANNIQLQKVSLSDTNRTSKTVNIKFNISWEHSWRDSINWDAAWIIIKYKEPKDNLWKWKHAQLSVAGNNAGTAAGVKIVVPNDLMGAFFYRSQRAEGTISSENVKLLWNYGAAGVTNIDSVEVRVFATEMVYVPQGNYCLGDGNGTQRSSYSFQQKNAPNNYAVISDKWSPLINTDDGSGSAYSPVHDDITIFKNGFRISGTQGLDLNDDKTADNPDYPTGYKAFYCMKYKVTQGQYADFLNTPYANDTSAYALNSYLDQHRDYYNPGRYNTVPKELRAYYWVIGDDMNYTFPDRARNTIIFDSLTLKFNVTRPDRAYGRMNLPKSLSFADWLGLRPMSELEFEKACRGPLPPKLNERAWGDDSQYPASLPSYPFNFSGPENGTEVFSDYDVSKRNMDPVGSSPSASPTTGGDGGSGPYRVGIYATNTSSRVSSGSSYYGITDLSKITSEIVIPLSNSAYRTHSFFSVGKGILSAFGYSYRFSNLDAPVPETTIKFTYTSARGNMSNLYAGFHAARLAPSDN